MKPYSPHLAVFLCALCAEPSIAHAQSADADRIAARAIAFEANAALMKKDYATAAAGFARAEALVHAPTLLLGLARAKVGLGKLVTARKAYARIVREGVPPHSPAVFSRAVEEAKNELAALEQRMSAVVVEEKGAPDFRTTRDLAPAPRATPITALRAPDAVTFAPPPPARASDLRKTLGFVALGIGSAALVTGAVTGILTLERESELSATCPNKHCPPSAQSTIDTYSSLRIVAGSTLISGAALAATGSLLILTIPKPRSERAFVRPAIGVGYLSLEGAF